MSEGPEVETERLREAIRKELEKEGGAFLKRIALTTAILAALATIASLYAYATVHEAVGRMNEAVGLQAMASNDWVFYQATEIKAAVAEASTTAWLALGKPVPPKFADSQKYYTAVQEVYEQEARRREHERDAKSVKADYLLYSHYRFAVAVALFQIAIALGAVAALTRSHFAWLASLVMGASGTGLLIYAFIDY